MSFSNLHVHSFSSILDGAGSIDRYAELAKEFGLPALAITEHGNLSSAYELWQTANKHGLKSINGCEFYLFREKDEYAERLLEVYKRKAEERGEVFEESIDDIASDEDDDSEDAIEKVAVEVEEDTGKKKKKKDKSSVIKDFDRERYHQIVLVKNEIGWKNICKLNYYSFQKPEDKTYQADKGVFYYKPMIKRPYLFEAKEGLIVTSTCMISEINRYIRYGLYDDANALVEMYRKHFKDDFYLELQLNGVNDGDANQAKINEKLIEFGRAQNIKLILTSDTHYSEKDDAPFQDVMMAIAQGKKLDDPDLFTLNTRSLYFPSRSDYHELNEQFEYGYSKEFIDECLDNTLEIVDKVDFGFKKGKHYPKFNANVDDSKKQFGKLVIDALRTFITDNHLSVDDAKKYKERVKYEHDIIVKNGYTDYFLVVWDIIRFCKEKDIWTGIGRGSVGSSLIAYLLGIAGLNPLKYDLFFERFINPDGLAEPDIDMDFDSERRHEILTYLKEKWGEENVIQVANFTRFNIKQALRDLLRVFGKNNFDDAKFFASDKVNLPEGLSPETIDGWFDGHKDENDAISRRIYTWYLDNKNLVEIFKKMYGEVRNIGLHAGGILITPEPVYNYIPVHRANKALVTGFPEASGNVAKEGMITRKAHKTLTDLGLLKIDVLGLATVMHIRKTVELVKKNRGLDIRNDVVNVDLENEELYKVIAKGDNKLVFQFESQGMSELVRNSKPTCFEEVAVLNSLYRPGTLNSGAAKTFSEVCSGKKEQETIHPLVDDILSHSKGVVAFQEQISRIINKCTGISFGIAEKMRKAISDGKYPEMLVKFNEEFVPLCIKNGISEDVAEGIKKMLIDNAGYSFNSCFAAGTKVKTRDGFKYIQDFEEGDMVYSYDPITKKIYETKVKKLHINRLSDDLAQQIQNSYKNEIWSTTVKTRFGEEQMRCTMLHKFMIENGTMSPLNVIMSNGQKNIDKVVFAFDEEDIDILELGPEYRKEGLEETYDLEIDDKNHNFILSSGIVTSNSHAFSYSYLAMQTLYLKLNYPDEYYSVRLSSIEKPEEMFEYISDAMKNGITVVPPNVLKSSGNFEPISERTIAGGLTMIKGLGDKASEEILANRYRLNTLTDFLLHPWKKANKGHFLGLIRAGAFVDVEPNTKIALMLAEYHFENKKDLDKKNRQKEIKYSAEMLVERYELLKSQDIANFDEVAMDEEWKVATGFRYPFRNRFMPYLERFAEHNIVGLSAWRNSNPVVYGEIIGVEAKPAKNGKTFYRVKVTDGFSETTIKVFDNQMRSQPKLKQVQDGDLICIELEHDDTYGYNFKRGGKFVNLSRD